MQKIDFYFDFLSPYSYFAWKAHQIELSSFEIEWVYRPVLMGKLFSHHEFRGPGEIPAKRNYELKNCFRIATRDKVEFHPPSQFPFNPLAIIRLATLSANNSDKESQKKIINFIFNQVWGKGLILEDPDLVQNLMKENNFNEEIFQRSFEREAKLELKKNIKECAAKNIFGVPSFYLEDEFFWGRDSMQFLTNYLTGNDNWDKELYDRLLDKR